VKARAVSPVNSNRNICRYAPIASSSDPSEHKQAQASAGMPQRPCRVTRPSKTSRILIQTYDRIRHNSPLGLAEAKPLPLSGSNHFSVNAAGRRNYSTRPR
jgi:hypothetical protein